MKSFFAPLILSVRKAYMRKQNLGYFDYASITPYDPEVEYQEHCAYRTLWANPGSLHRYGVRAYQALVSAREKVAHILKAHSDEIVFTASGTEANSLAIVGYIEHLRSQGILYADMHIIVSTIEHQSVLALVDDLEKKGVHVSRISVNQGVFDIENFEKILRPNTTLISCMLVNNEVGLRLPLEEIIKITRRKSPSCVIHTDACQAGLYEKISLEKLGVHMLTLDSHKINGPRGIGTLFIRRGTVCAPVIRGGGQENGKRSGTENVPGIHAFAYALGHAYVRMDTEAQRIQGLREYFEKKITDSEILRNYVSCLCPEARKAPHISSLLLAQGIDPELMLLRLDARGIYVSTKSACLKDEDESYVLRELGYGGRHALRFSFGLYSTQKGVDRAVAALEEIVKKYGV